MTRQTISKYENGYGSRTKFNLCKNAVSAEGLPCENQRRSNSAFCKPCSENYKNSNQ